MNLKDLKIKIYADGADLNGMIAIAKSGLVKGLTTNPTLMKKAGLTDYKTFAKQVLENITDLPISFEVFTDDFTTMELEAREIASWGPNVYVKIPITNTKGESSIALIEKLSNEGIKLNITAIMTYIQVRSVVDVLKNGVPSIVSVFAGRIADTGMDPLPLMVMSVSKCREKEGCELLWASTREMLNIFQANKINCDIITVTNDILKKENMIDMNLENLSLDTVKMFANDASSAGFKII